MVEGTLTDDGHGTVDPARGTGLRGLTDRIAALGGRLTVAPATGGTKGGRPPGFDHQIYAKRNTVERGYLRLKQWRGIAPGTTNTL